MSQTNNPTQVYSLNGRSIRMLKLTQETEEKLRLFGIVTLEQLAKLALNGSGVYERAVIEAIYHELSARLAPYKLTCSTASSFAAHFIIAAEGLFFCKASVIPDDDTSWICTYQWHFQEAHHSICDTLVLFHKPHITIASHVFVSEHLSDNSSPDIQAPNELVGQTFDAPQPVTYRSEARPLVQRVHKVEKRTSAGSLKSAAQTKGTVNGQQPELPWESYDIWNHAIATYVTVGAQRGSTVYLSIDDEVIEQIGRRLQTQEGQPPEAFLNAIQHRVVRGRRIVLELIRGHNRHGEPNCIAFLAAMVLAASRMAEDEEEEIASSNYFARFCEVLDLDQDNGRPRGMRFGADDEEPLWREWVVWLGEIGLISSALPGEGAKRYINYPISQALLRSTDRARLRRLFTDLRWYESWAPSTLIMALRRDSYRLSTHLRALLADQSQRIEAVTEGVCEIYEEWLSGASGDQSDGQVRGRVLLADVMRNADPISGDIEYFLYPRSPRRQQFDNVVVQIADQTYTLFADRPGWYMPLCAIDEQQLYQGARFAIEQPAGVDALVLPCRNFWILSPDPDNTESGVFASWGAVPLGTHFIILCRRDLIPQLESLRAERLIEWNGEPQALGSLGDWVEVAGCMVISPTWDGVEIESRDLHEALRPRVNLSISLSGGLRAPQGGWLIEFGPQVTIFGFPPEAEVMVTRITDSYKLLEDIRPTNRPFDVAWPASGDYLVEVVSGTINIRRLVKIVDWEELEAAPVTNLEWLKIGELYLCGALISDQTQGDADATLV